MLPVPPHRPTELVSRTPPRHRRFTPTRGADIAPSAKRAITRCHGESDSHERQVLILRGSSARSYRVTPGCSSPCGRPYSPSVNQAATRLRHSPDIALCGRVGFDREAVPSGR